MHKIKINLLIIFILIVTSCREPIEYQFINSPKTIDCEGLGLQSKKLKF